MFAVNALKPKLILTVSGDGPCVCVCVCVWDRIVILPKALLHRLLANEIANFIYEVIYN